jgi:hypothetical protein
MTLHQLTHTPTFDLEFGFGGTIHRLLADLGQSVRSWAAARRLESDLAGLDHRERADLACRRS